MEGPPATEGSDMQKRTWIWIVLGIVGLLMVGCFAVVGTGVYLVSTGMDGKLMMQAWMPLFVTSPYS